MTQRELRLAILVGTRSYSETFIEAHIERISASISILYGERGFPDLYDDGQPLLSPLENALHNLATLFSRRALYKVLRQPHAGLGDRWQVKGLSRFLKTERIDAVLAEFGPRGVSVMEACRKADVPLIVHFFGYDAYEHRCLRIFGPYYPQLFDIAARIVVVSRDMEKQLLKLGAPPHKITCNPCGADCTRFGGATPGQAPPRFIAIGRFADKKAPALTLRAFARAQAEIPEAKLVMAGDGPLLQLCQELAQKLEITDSVEFAGVIDQDEAAARMKTARAFVQHSVTAESGDSEGTPVAILEAGAMGLPVISTLHAGIKDAVIHEQTGLLGPERDIDCMARHMIRLAKDPGLAAELGANARLRICSDFEINAGIDRLDHLIRSTVEGNPTSTEPLES